MARARPSLGRSATRFGIFLRECVVCAHDVLEAAAAGSGGFAPNAEVDKTVVASF